MFPTPFRSTSDQPIRDITTTEALLGGLGLPVQYDIQPKLFNPTETGVCTALPMKEQISEMQKMYDMIFNDPSATKEHLDRLTRLQNIIGKGVAPPMETIKESIISGSWGGTYSGGAAVANSMTEAFIMQNGGGIKMAWGRLSSEDLYSDYLKSHILYRRVMCRTPKVAKRRHSNLLNAIIDALSNTNEKGTRLFVGHDGDLDGMAAILGLAWESTPFAANATTPQSGLRFDLFDDPTDGNVQKIRITLYYTTFDTDDAKVMVVPANFSKNTHKNTMVWDDFKTFAAGEMDMECVDKKIM